MTLDELIEYNKEALYKLEWHEGAHHSPQTFYYELICKQENFIVVIGYDEVSDRYHVGLEVRLKDVNTRHIKHHETVTGCEITCEFIDHLLKMYPDYKKVEPEVKLDTINYLLGKSLKEIVFD